MIQVVGLGPAFPSERMEYLSRQQDKETNPHVVDDLRLPSSLSLM